MRAAVACLIAAACSGDASTTPAVEHVEPPYGPLHGGTTIRIDGARFSPEARVLVGGREAPFVHAVTDERLDVVIPPSDHAGDAEVLVIDHGRNASARGLFRYSDPPAIASVSPADVWIGSYDTVVTLTGSGFLDEDAGHNQIVVGGATVQPMTVTDDSTIRFIAPNGAAFTHSDIELTNDRGRAFVPSAVRNTPGQNPGLLLFPKFGGPFVVFYDPVGHTSTAVGWPTSTTQQFSTVVRDTDGSYWAVDYNDRVGRLDLPTRTFAQVGTLSTRIPASVLAGIDIVAVERDFSSGASLVKLNPSSLQIAPFGAGSLFCCGWFGLATDGTTIWLTTRKDYSSSQIQTVDPMTGALGTPVPLVPPGSFRIEELRYVGGTLYATGTTGGLATVDPATGAMALVPDAPTLRFGAMEGYE